MTTSEAIDMFKEISRRTCGLALGGYPSLVAHGILDEERSTKDLDIVAFSQMNAESLYFHVNDIVYSIVHTCNRILGGKYRINQSNRMNSNPDDHQFKNLEDMGVNASVGLNFTFITGSSTKIPFDEISDDVVEYMSDACSPLIAAMGNCRTFSIDIFKMHPKYAINVTSMIDGVKFVKPYYILKAKYEYCLNKNTGKEMFNKHLNDLELSYNKIRIVGVNDPDTISTLKKNRDESK